MSSLQYQLGHPTKSVQPVKAGAFYNLEYVQFQKRNGALYRLWDEHIQLPESWDILSVGSRQCGWGTLPRRQKRKRNVQGSWGILHLILYPAYHPSRDI